MSRAARSEMEPIGSKCPPYCPLSEMSTVVDKIPALSEMCSVLHKLPEMSGAPDKFPAFLSSLRNGTHGSQIISLARLRT